jgi:hypothetical protein
MSNPSIPATSLPGIPISCSVNLPAVPATFPGLIALGPSRSERDILYQCCHTLETQRFSVNGTECLQTAVCQVEECSLRDPSFACVALVRWDWKVEGAFGCLEGGKESGGMRMKARMGVLVVGVVLGVLGVGGL